MTSIIERDRLGWAVTDLDGETVLESAPRLTRDLLLRWHGAMRIWRTEPDGALVELTPDEYDYANERARETTTWNGLPL